MVETGLFRNKKRVIATVLICVTIATMGSFTGCKKEDKNKEEPTTQEVESMTQIDEGIGEYTTEKPINTMNDGELYECLQVGDVEDVIYEVVVETIMTSGAYSVSDNLWVYELGITIALSKLYGTKYVDDNEIVIEKYAGDEMYAVDKKLIDEISMAMWNTTLSDDEMSDIYRNKETGKYYFSTRTDRGSIQFQVEQIYSEDAGEGYTEGEFEVYGSAYVRDSFYYKMRDYKINAKYSRNNRFGIAIVDVDENRVEQAMSPYEALKNPKVENMEEEISLCYDRILYIYGQMSEKYAGSSNEEIIWHTVRNVMEQQIVYDRKYEGTVGKIDLKGKEYYQVDDYLVNNLIKLYAGDKEMLPTTIPSVLKDELIYDSEKKVYYIKSSIQEDVIEWHESPTLLSSTCIGDEKCTYLVYLESFDEESIYKFELTYVSNITEDEYDFKVENIEIYNN